MTKISTLSFTHLHVTTNTQTVDTCEFRWKATWTKTVYYNPLIFLNQKNKKKHIQQTATCMSLKFISADTSLSYQE